MRLPWPYRGRWKDNNPSPMHDLEPESQQPQEGPSPTEAQQRWREYGEVLSKWYHKPDLSAVRCSLAAWAIHRDRNTKPVWVLFVGSSSSGKSSTIMEPLSYLPDCHDMGVIGPNSFLSGYTKGMGGKTGLLATLPHNQGVLLWNDISLLASLRKEMRGEVLAQLRQIHDGSLVKVAGNQPKPLQWAGKVTILGAGTEDAIELLQDDMHLLGERFIYLRLEAPRQDQEAREARVNQMTKHLGKESQMKREMREALEAFIGDPSTLYPITRPIDPRLVEGITSLSHIVTALRMSLKYDTRGNMIGVSQTEEAQRTIKSCLTLAMGNAMLFRRHHVIPTDAHYVKRVMLDMIPPIRRRIVEALARSFPQGLSVQALASMTRLTHPIVAHHVSDLEHLFILQRNDEGLLVMEEEFAAHIAVVARLHLSAQAQKRPHGARVQ